MLDKASRLTRICPACGSFPNNDCNGAAHIERDIVPPNVEVKRIFETMAAIHIKWITDVTLPYLPDQFANLKVPDEQRSAILLTELARLRKAAFVAGATETPQARQLDDEEACKNILTAIANLAHHWGTVEPAALGCETMSPLERCNSMAFSILSLIDGTSFASPALNLVPAYDDSDIVAFEAIGEDYLPRRAINQSISLHDMWVEIERSK